MVYATFLHADTMSNVSLLDQHEVVLLNHQSNNSVIFENGLMANLESWKPVFLSLKNTNILAYNRYGYGNSSIKESPRDAQTIVEELRVLLSKANLKPPYILVGHSLGGLYMQYFANAYPDEVKALILVDSTHPQQFANETAYENWPFYVKAAFNLLANSTQKDEFTHVETTGKSVTNLAPYSGPIWILSSLESQNDDSNFGKAAHEKRKDLQNLYPHAKQIWLDCGHNISYEKPESIIELINEAMKL